MLKIAGNSVNAFSYISFTFLIFSIYFQDHKEVINLIMLLNKRVMENVDQ